MELVTPLGRWHINKHNNRWSAYHDDDYHQKLHPQVFNIALVKKIQIRKNDQPLPNNPPVEKFAQVDQMARQYRYRHPCISHEPIWPDRIRFQDVEGDITGNEKYILANQRATYHTEQYYHIRWNQSMDQLSQLNWKTYTTNYERSSPAHKNLL